MTRNELYKAALVRLNVIGATEEPNAEDGAQVAAKYESLHAMLLQKGLVAWALTADIPEGADIPVTSMLAWAACREFSVDEQTIGSLTNEGALDLPEPSLAERQLRRLLNKNYVSYPATSDYF